LQAAGQRNASRSRRPRDAAATSMSGIATLPPMSDPSHDEPDPLEDARRRAVAAADQARDDVRLQAAAAYACDRVGREHDAVRYYTRAWELGGPDDDRAGFMLGYGSTLRNVGRHDDSIGILGQAVLEHPHHAALRAFLALSLHAAGHHALALATMLEAGLAAAPTAFDPYRRALGDYLAELHAAALPV
jgi:Flp pilus assembly protein TadD